MIRICKDEDIKDIRKLYYEAFDDSEAFVDFYFKDKLIPEKVVIIEENSSLISMMHLNPFKVFFNEGLYDISYFVAIATNKEYRQKGYMKKLMAYALNKLYSEGEIFSLLMPIDSRIYERYGFGFIEDNLHFDIDSSKMMHKHIDGIYREATVNDFNLLVDYYTIYCKTFNLITYRDVKSFERIYSELLTEDGKIILFEDGYLMVYYYQNILCVREIVCNTKKVFNEMMTYLQKKTDYTRVIIDDHFKSKVKYVIPNIKENQISLKPFMMARIINVEELIRRNINLFNKDINVKIVDPFIEQNNHCYKIEEQGVIVNDGPKYDIQLDIKTFTQLVFGYIDEVEVPYINLLNNNENGRKLLSLKKSTVNFFNEYD